MGRLAQTLGPTITNVRQPTPHFAELGEIFNANSKRELTKHCKNLVVYRQDLASLILAAQHGILAPYKYANHFARALPDHLHPTDAEQDAIASNGVGTFRSREASKFATKVFQLFREQRSLAAHLFYTSSQNHWHLFYFDNRDTSEEQNHWKHGPHLHYVSNLWPELTMKEAWMSSPESS
jgi:hypothetical protein